MINDEVEEQRRIVGEKKKGRRQKRFGVDRRRLLNLNSVLQVIGVRTSTSTKVSFSITSGIRERYQRLYIFETDLPQ